MDKRCYDYLLKQIKQKQPRYYTLYCISIAMSYIFVIFFALYLTSLAYNNFLFISDIDKILYFQNKGFNQVLINYFLYLVLLDIIFYVINEIRFRVISIKSIRKIKKIELEFGNLVVYITTVILFTLLTLFI